jgi:hypothetical protein
MPRKKHRAEEIVAKLRQVEVPTARGKPVAEAIPSIGVTEKLRDELLNGEISVSDKMGKDLALTPTQRATGKAFQRAGKRKVI